MNEHLRTFLFSLTILLPAIIGILKYGGSDRSFRPFLWYIFISCLNEVWVGLHLVEQSNEWQIFNWHIFNLFECFILLMQFHLWGRFRRNNGLFIMAVAFLAAFWVGENIVFSKLFVYNTYFLVIYSFVLVLLSINTINYVVVNHHQSLFRNGMFIICVGMLIFFIYTMIIFTFLTAEKSFNKTYLVNIFNIRVYINALVNIIYASGIYFIPRKAESSNYFN
jgi:hypothetical protein